MNKQRNNAGLGSVAMVLALVHSSQAKAEPDFRAAVCRVSNTVGGATNLGSGTLVDITDDGHEGLVLTCAHLFSEGTGDVLVRFAEGKTHRARVIDVDRQADLAALAIADPRGSPVAVAEAIDRNTPLHACGYGPRGVYRCAVGSQAGQSASEGRLNLLVTGTVRSGDSGGGVFDSQGRLVGVVWGTAEGVTYASSGRPLRRFLSRVLGQRTSVVYRCPGGVCPRSPQSRPQLPSPAPSADQRWKALEQQLEQLRNEKQDRGDYVTRDEWQQLEAQTATQHTTLLGRLQHLDSGRLAKVGGSTALNLLGLSGPMGWAAIAATGVGGWLIGQRMKRRRGAGGRREVRFRGEA